MNRIEVSVLLASVLAVGLTACSATSMRGNTADRAASISNTSDSSNPLSDTESMAAPTPANRTTAGAPPGRSSDLASVPQATFNSTVMSIEVVPRQGEGADTSAGTVAGAAVGGTGTASSTERVFRITLRTDDGQTHTITQEWAPAFSTGDRVRMENGVIRR